MKKMKVRIKIIGTFGSEKKKSKVNMYFLINIVPIALCITFSLVLSKFLLLYS